ncbi:MAG: hypothetical protein ACP5F3_00680 [Candidatus Syntrophosphaera sp.]
MISTTDYRYKFTGDGDFVIMDYNSTKPFSSFFPGVAGKSGIPMWTFYVNRGQCLCSMGIEGKHHPIMEFLPANWAYNLVPTQGFRTFVKLPDNPSRSFYEPFQNNLRDEEHRRFQRMLISPASLVLQEVNETLGLKFIVEYFNIPGDRYAGLARKLTIQNLNQKPVKLQVLDGLPMIVPYGLDDWGLKHMRRLFEAFVEVVNHEQRVPFYKLKVEPADRPDVVRIAKGNFYLGFGTDHKLVSPVCDPVKVFGIRGDYNFPEKFLSEPFEEVLSDQRFENRLPCAMGSFETTLAEHRTYTYISVIGHAGSLKVLQGLVPNITQEGYLENKAAENRKIISSLTQKSFICSAEPVLDHYARQTFLDNLLRGGFPHTLRGKVSTTTLHLYSRKHGDLERDYNDFRLTPTPYSQGNGNFRDVNQNRRCDLYFNPDVREANMVQFYNLIQLDGFNPLVIKEVRFVVSDDEKLESLLAAYLDPDNAKTLSAFLRDPFTPGEVNLHLNELGIEVRGEVDNFIGELLGICEKQYCTAYGEGFWTDHWTYNLDLLENYLAIYPEEEKRILFKEKIFTFYDNPHRVLPREDKYVVWDGKPMQLGAVVLDEEKEQLIEQRASDRNQVRVQNGRGDIYSTTLYVKMLCLVANKLASLDPEGVGVEMEADKPGWYDALNGLPGLHGSSISETLELKRHILFLLSASYTLEGEFALFSELKHFMETLHGLLAEPLSAFDFWDRATGAKEEYRALTRLGISGKEEKVTFAWSADFLKAALAKIEEGISMAWEEKSHVISTYFVNEVAEFEQLVLPNGEIKRNEKGLPCFRAKKFRQLPLPLFLEGPVHFLRCGPKPEEAASLAESVRQSGLFDTALKMYKVNESLDSQPMEIGRARTFSPGWFENESVWLHMEYKYMLELLRNKLYGRFYDDFKHVFVPFMDPGVYGRSILENTSFIVSSANPDPSVHGNGFMARLSGATAEFVSILYMMALGQKPFALGEDGNLELRLEPALPGWLFTQEARQASLYADGELKDFQFPANTFSIMFLGRVLLTYHNPSLYDTFGPQAVSPHRWKITRDNGEIVEFSGPVLTGEIVPKIRDRQVARIEVTLK